MPDLDPLSQLIGGLTAQVSNIARDLTDLRSEIVTNRNLSSKWRDEIADDLEKVRREFGNAKHDYRAFEQARIAIDGRLADLERMLTKWRLRAATVLGGSAVVGALAGAITEPFIHYGLTRVFG